MMKTKGFSVTSISADELKNSKRTPWKTPEDKRGKFDISSPDALLQCILGSTHVATFFSDFWEKEPLHVVRGDETFYGDCFNLDVMKHVVGCNDMKFLLDINAFTLTDGNKQEFVQEQGAVTAESIDRLMKEKKAVLEFSHPQRFIDDFWNIMEKLETHFGCLWDAHAYLTPPGQKGAAPHCDDVENFILQTEGSSEWKLWKPVVELSRDFTQDVSEETLGLPMKVVTMKPGDLLYFPRGVVYQCLASDQGHSTHIAMSTYQDNAWGDFMIHAIQHAIETALENDVGIRGGLPINYRSFLGTALNMDAYVAEAEKEDAKKDATPETPVNNLSDERVVKFKEDIQKRLSDLVDHLDVNKSADAMCAEFMASRLPPYGYCRCDGADHQEPATEEVNEEAMETETTTETAAKTEESTESTTKTTETTPAEVTKTKESITKEPKMTIGLTDQIKIKYPDHFRVVYVNDDDDADDDDDDAWSDVTSQTDSQVDDDDMDDVKTVTSQEEETDKSTNEGTDTKTKKESVTEDEDDEEADVTDTEPHVQVLHSLTNDRFTHMGFSIYSKVGRLRFDVSYAKALVALSSSAEYLAVKELPIESDSEKLFVASRLAGEGLLDMKPVE